MPKNAKAEEPEAQLEEVDKEADSTAKASRKAEQKRLKAEPEAAAAAEEVDVTDAKANAKAKAAAKEEKRQKNKELRERFADDPDSLTTEEKLRAKELTIKFECTEQARKVQAAGVLVTAEIGARVVRGPDWKWGNQDGGPGSLGTVISFENPLGIEGKARVKWDTGKENNYNVGHEGRFDLKKIEAIDEAMSQNQKKKRRPDAAGLPKLDAKGDVGVKPTKKARNADDDEDDEPPEKKWKEQASANQVFEQQRLRQRFLENPDKLTQEERQRAEVLIERDERKKIKRAATKTAKDRRAEKRDSYRQKRREEAIAKTESGEKKPKVEGQADESRSVHIGKGKDGAKGKSKGKGKGKSKSAGRGDGDTASSSHRRDGGKGMARAAGSKGSGRGRGAGRGVNDPTSSAPRSKGPGRGVN